MTTMTIRIPEGLRKDLEKLCKRQRRSSSDVVRESLRKYLALEQMNQLREKLRPHAEAAGFLTDEDVFKAAS
ncbi:MAG: ribbon-helix-helix protein, CopG family [Phycisphaerae bacterium]|nr:ribbon-helix-helix protein, CopG family [Phycisphaerae bacterium]